jgi:spore maturation protein CgeB
VSGARPVKVCYFHNPLVAGAFHNYELATLDPTPYFAPSRGAGGVRASRAAARKVAALHTAAGVDALYRERDAAYMRFAGDFVDAFADAALVILATYNPVHPEILHHRLRGPTKILGFIDDPHSSYVRGIPYLWAFDGAFYISPGYNADHDFPTALRAWGCRDAHWFPLVPRPLPTFEASEDFFGRRDVDVVYVGGSYGAKIDRLVRLKRALGERFRVHGRWGLNGYVGIARALLGKPLYPYRVTTLSDSERTGLYLRAKIGINMHLSNALAETGNMRMYEVPAHGALLLCDKSARDAHDGIFRDGVEAVYYDDVEDALRKIEYYVAHDSERITIARRGYERATRDYTFDVVLKGLLDWGMAIRARSARC